MCWMAKKTGFKGDSANIYAEISQQCSALESYCQSPAPLTGSHLMYFQQEGT